MPLRDLLRDSFQILNGYDDWTFAPETALFTVRDHFKVASLDGFGLKDRTAAIGAAGAVLHYLTQHLRRDVKHLTRLSFYQPQRFSRARLHDAAASGNSGAAAPRRPAQRLALRRGQPHRHADGRAALARLAFATARRRRADPPPAGSGADVHRKFRRTGQFPGATRATCAIWSARLGRLSSGSGNARDLVALRVALEQIPAVKEILDAKSERGRLVRELKLKREVSNTSARDATNSRTSRPRS